MEEDGVVPCSSIAVESIIRVGTAGAIWGICSGPYDARKQGLTGVARASFVASSVAKLGFQCGLVSGIYSMTRCGIQRYRERDDWVNGVIAGAIVGAAVAAGTRNWKQVIGMSCLLAALGAANDYSRTS